MNLKKEKRLHVESKENAGPKYKAETPTSHQLRKKGY